MMSVPEPPFSHDRSPKLGVLLVNLGTPDAPTPSAVRRYLAQFLSDPRVIEIPAWAWKPILYGVILLVRPPKSARKYSAIWTKDGSPLLVHSLRQRTLLMGYLGQRLKTAGHAADLCAVEIGMRYGNPSIGARDRQAARRGLRKDPRAAALSSVFGERNRLRVRRRRRALVYARRLPALRFVETFHADEGYVKALAQNVNDYWVKNGRPDHFVMSFHGLPRRTLERGDPYHCFCQVTGRMLATELGLSAGQWTLTFQSRFGKAPWLKPYTVDVVKSLGARRGRSGSTSSARDSSPTASRPSRKSAWRSAQRSPRPAARIST